MPQGSLRSRKLKSGKTVYDLIFDIPAPPGKTRAQEKEVFHGTKKAAQAELAKRIAEAWGDGVAPDRDLTLAAFLDEWLAVYKRRCRESSYDAREQVVRLHIKPALGHLKLVTLGPRAIQRWLDGKEAEGFKPNYLRDMLGTLKMALNHAVAMEVATRNAAASIRAPGQAEPVGVSWTVEEARAFLDSERDRQDWPMWVVAANGQLRRSEIVGLRWEDVDTERGLLRVERQLIEVKGGGLRIGPPKTAKSKRVLPMAAAVMTVLADHKRRQEARKAEGERLGTWDENDGWIFDIGDGGPQHPRTAFDRFKRACRRAGVPVIRLHDLRSTGITLMGESGTHEWIVAERAGHSDTRTTRGYAHPAQELQRVAAEALAGLLGLGSEDVAVEVRPAAD